jgi:hypothetical protein
MALPVSGVKGLTARLNLAATRSPASVRVTTVAAGGQVSTRDVAIGADAVSTMALEGVSSVWVTPAAGTVRAAVLTSAADTAGQLLSVTPLTDLTLVTTPWPLRQMRD